MKRAALVFGVVAVLLLADGLWMEITHYQPGDQNSLFGNPHFIVSDGTTVLVAAGLLALAAVVMWVVAVRRETPPAHAQAAHRGSRPGSRV
ncbi:MAG: hypothetical protein ACLP5E_28605 [Streptosporangiaceae bacterium]